MEAVARVATDQPARYIKQLVSHLGHRLTTRIAGDGSGEIVLDVGRCTLVEQPGTLVLTAVADDAEELARVCDVVGRHLQRFGGRESLTVDWTSSG
jgi:hypothetical protein